MIIKNMALSPGEIMGVGMLRPFLLYSLISAILCCSTLGNTALANEPPESDLNLAELPCPPDPALGPEVAAERLLYAFTRLDQACFNQMWTEDATAFLPLLIGEAGPGRLNGRDQILATFDKFFGGRQASQEDVLDINPVSLRVDRRGDVAIASFVLGPALDNRRTFVFRREEDGWRIWHHHASWLGDFEAILETEVQRRVSEITVSE
ncbi:DUF4440 domain-containing protein [Erythrobacter gaetbuli]|uniref:DUF4440 domain-containing protein n=1 Tax=Qipengyuania gaetbuli TaxID=266952 RepID=A0A844XUH8_9SPHN|nr:nuclear transport factor 2 family protein [Qipengyuania gaetbuli]MXO49735.1 DUF4440 domain-containing protein [Qipengyuania gaetbuli]